MSAATKHVPVVQREDNSIHRQNHYPVDSVLCSFKIYPLDSDCSVDSVIHPLNNRAHVICLSYYTLTVIKPGTF